MGALGKVRKEIRGIKGHKMAEWTPYTGFIVYLQRQEPL